MSSDECKYYTTKRNDGIQKQLEAVRKNRTLYSSLTFDNPNTPFPTTLNEDGTKNVDTSKRKYRFNNEDLSVQDVQARRKYEALKCLAYANAGKEKYRTNLKIVPRRFRNRMYQCNDVVVMEAKPNHVFHLPSGGARAFPTQIPFFPLNSVGSGSSAQSDSIVNAVLTSTGSNAAAAGGAQL